MKFSDLPELEQRLIWDRDYRTEPIWVRLPVETARAVLYVSRGFTSGELTLRAMSLVYTTILSLVPLLAFSFSVLKGFGVQNQVEPLLLEYLSPLGPEKASEISERIVEFVNNIDVRVLGAVGLGLLVYTIVTLMQKIEAAFNHAWHIGRNRSLGERFATFISVLTVGPLLVFTALAITGTLMNNNVMQALAAREPFGLIIHEIARLVPYVLVITAFTFVYMLVPNTRVRFRAALAGGVVAGVLWETAGYVFAYFVSSATKYQAVYATFGTAMFFMIWLYVSWLILLVGATTAFYVQQPRTIVARARRWRFSYATFEEIALQVLTHVTRRHYAREAPYSLDALGETLGISQEMIEEVLGALEARSLLKQTADDPPAWLLAVPPEETLVADIVEAVRAYHPTGSRPVRPPQEDATRAVREAIGRATREALGEHTLKALAEDDGGALEPGTRGRVQPEGAVHSL